MSTTDGYHITASFEFLKFTGYSTGGVFDCDATNCIIGTCVETMDAAGVVVASTVVDDGNIALCHWFLLSTFWLTTRVVAGTTNDYSVIYHMTAAEWGTAGNAFVGNGLETRGT